MDRALRLRGSMFDRYNVHVLVLLVSKIVSVAQLHTLLEMGWQGLTERDKQMLLNAAVVKQMIDTVGTDDVLTTLFSMQE